ncbi:MAG TPA: cobyric acid synthase [Bryobacteraceae bacterium]|nr:cobyric acid synthase [Bryobacteraceae bacterium]
MAAKAIFVGGTTSHAGKSWMATAICAHLKRRGLRVAPFKAQNMSNNSYVAGNGGEIGRAQAAQAEACGLEPHTDMNPILLKPHSDQGSQVVLHGRVWRDLSATAYYDHFDWLLEQVLEAYRRLAARFDYIVIEGAGSVAEVNLASRDLVNFGLARRIGAPALLVADINRGGVFASLIGTLQLLEEEDRRLVRSFAVNRFRGDLSLFTDGVEFLERKMDRPCLGVFPYARDIRLAAEDGVSLEEMEPSLGNIAAIGFPHISNVTDLDRLRPEWVFAPVQKLFTHVILPGTKNTEGDLDWLKRQRLDLWVKRQHAAGARIIGVCGGYQMLGRFVDGQPGLDLLPVNTVMLPEKTVKRVRATTPGGSDFEAYEIHMGETGRAAEPFAWIEGNPEGSCGNNVFGTYLHGALESEHVCRELGLEVHQKSGSEYDKLADWFENTADLELFGRLYL